MNTGKTIFSQIMSFMPKYEFDKRVIKYKGNYRIRQFSCWDQFFCMSFAQLTYRESLRDIVACLNAQPNKLILIALYMLWIQRQSICVYLFFLGRNSEKTKEQSNFIPYWIFRGQYRYLLRLQAVWYTMSISLMCLFLSLDLSIL